MAVHPYLMDINEANIRMRKLPEWEQMEAVRKVLEYFPDQWPGVGVGHGRCLSRRASWIASRDSRDLD